MSDNVTAHNFNQSYSNFTHSISSSLGLRVSLSVIAVLISMFIAVANGIIIVALITSIRRDQRRKENIITKILMTSMAFTDASLALTILPVAVYKIIQGGHVFLGTDWCLAEPILEYILCAVSIYHVVAMALDRYVAISRPLMYRKMTNRTGYVMISLAWIVPFALAGIFTIIPYLRVRKAVINGPTETITKCIVDMNIQIYFATAVISLYIPFLVIFILYFLILRDVGRFHRRRPQLQAQSAPQKVKHIYGPPTTPMLSESSAAVKVQHGDTDNRQTQDITSRPPNTCTHNSKMLTTSQDMTCPGTVSGITQIQSDGRQTNRSIQNNGRTELCSEGSSPDGALVVEGQGYNCEQSGLEGTNQTNIAGNRTQPLRQNKTVSLKAVRTVGSIVICFTLCWLPFAIYASVRVQGAITGSDTVDMAMNWLGYFNSALNPLVYCTHRSIRASVKHLIRCRSQTL